MRLSLGTMLTAILVAASNVCLAQPSDRFPESRTVHIEGERYEAFDLEGFIGLLELDAELEALTLEYELMSEQLIISQENVGLLEGALELSQENAEIFNSERRRLLERWTEENLARHESTARSRLISIVGWVTAGVLFLTTAGSVTLLAVL